MQDEDSRSKETPLVRYRCREPILLVASQRLIRLNGYVYTVTGGTGTLGLEAARALLEHGCSGVVLFDKNPVHGSTDLSLLMEEFPSLIVKAQEVDVTDALDVNAAFEEAAKTLGTVDMLLCFAGVVGCIHALEMKPQEWRRMLDINTTGSFLCAQAAAKYVTHIFFGGSRTYLSSVSQTDDRPRYWWQHRLHSLHLRASSQLSTTTGGVQRVQSSTPASQELARCGVGPVRYSRQQHQSWLYGHDFKRRCWTRRGSTSLGGEKPDGSNGSAERVDRSGRVTLQCCRELHNWHRYRGRWYIAPPLYRSRTFYI